MKKNILTLSITVFIFMLFFVTNGYAAPVLSLVPNDSSITNDDFYLEVLPLNQFKVDVYFDLSANDYPTGLYGATFNINFDPAILEVITTSYNSFIFQDTQTSTISLNIDNILFGLLDNLDDNGGVDKFLMASATFQAKEGVMGTTFLTTNEFSAGDNFDFTTQAGESIDASVIFKGGEINVVPIPGAILLLGSGLLGLIGIGSRRMRKS